MNAANDPRNLSPDQRDLLDVLEQLGRLPQPVDEEAFLPLSEQALDLLEARGLALRGDEKLTIETLSKYRRGLAGDGFELAAAGMALLILRWFGETELRAGSTGPLN